MAHGREGFPKTQVTSAHDCILNDTVSVDILNLTGPERFAIDVNQHSLARLAAMRLCSTVGSQWPLLHRLHHSAGHKDPSLPTR